jgi:hypothetical protein
MPPLRWMNWSRRSESGLCAAAYRMARDHLLRVRLSALAWVGCATNDRGERTSYARPAASSMRFAIASGCDIRERWLAFISIVFAPMRLAIKRSRSGLMVRSSVETA